MHRTFVLRSEAQAKALYAFLKQNWTAMAEQDKPLAVTVTEAKSKRSTEQNRRYWALVNEIASQAWVKGKQYSAEAWHELMKRSFIGTEELPNGQTQGISTTALSVDQFGEYMNKVEQYGAEELGVTFTDNQ